MSDSIPFSKEHGVNPHLTFCPRCHGEANELALSGARHQYTCDSCGMVHLGRPASGHCENVNCHANTSGIRTLVDRGELDPSMRLPASQPCDACQAEIKTFNAEIKKGGIPIRCKDCGMEGVLKAEHKLAKKIRAEHGLTGLEFSKADCPKCSLKEGT